MSLFCFSVSGREMRAAEVYIIVFSVSHANTRQSLIAPNLLISLRLSILLFCSMQAQAACNKNI